MSVTVADNKGLSSDQIRELVLKGDPNVPIQTRIDNFVASQGGGAGGGAGAGESGAGAGAGGGEPGGESGAGAGAGATQQGNGTDTGAGAAGQADLTAAEKYTLTELFPGREWKTPDEARTTIDQWRQSHEEQENLFQDFEMNQVPESMRDHVRFVRATGSEDGAFYNIYRNATRENADDIDILTAAEFIDTPSLSHHYAERRAQIAADLAAPADGEAPKMSAYDRERLILQAKSKIAQVTDKVNAIQVDQASTKVNTLKEQITNRRAQWVNALSQVVDHVVTKNPDLPIYGEGEKAVKLPVTKDTFAPLIPKLVNYAVANKMEPTKENLVEIYNMLHADVVSRNLDAAFKNYHALQAFQEDAAGVNASKIDRDTSVVITAVDKYEQTMKELGLRGK